MQPTFPAGLHLDSQSCTMRDVQSSAQVVGLAEGDCEMSDLMLPCACMCPSPERFKVAATFVFRCLLNGEALCR